MLKALLWDNDGVLVDTEELYFRATREVLLEVGIDLSRDLFIRISLEQGRSAFDLASEQGLSQEVITRLRDDRNKRYSSLLRKGVRMLDGVENALRHLHGKVLMGVVTSSRREHFDIIHNATGLLRFFDFVLAREDYKKSKPNPEPFFAAMRQNGLKPEHCIIVEDSARGLAAAKAAGIRCIVVPTFLSRGSDFQGAYRVLDTIQQVPYEVLQLMSSPVDS
jgi:HAD superfamily hydrolase (TIGR01509 family)